MGNVNQIAQPESKGTGCGACMNGCPCGAIKMIARDGYVVCLEIDAKLCSKCGICLKTCLSAPPVHPGMKTDGDFLQIYGVYVHDETVRRDSSSGGFFTVLAEYTLKRVGVVYGSAFVTHGTEVGHKIIDSISNLLKFRDAKYVQSSTGLIYIRSPFKIVDVLWQCGRRMHNGQVS